MDMSTLLSCRLLLLGGPSTSVLRTVPLFLILPWAFIKVRAGRTIRLFTSCLHSCPVLFSDVSSGVSTLLSPMPGNVVNVEAGVNDSVQRGSPILTIESLGGNHVICAPFEATISEMLCESGSTVGQSDKLLKLTRAA